jgi:hypothetical protein
MLLDAFIGHEANGHPAYHLLGAVIPALGPVPMWRADSPAGPSSQRMVVGVEGMASELLV